MAGKGNKIELSTFEKYGKSEIIGYKRVEASGNTLVNFIWCKLCVKHKDSTLAERTLRGSVKASSKAFIEGTDVVSKCQVNESSLRFMLSISS